MDKVKWYPRAEAIAMVVSGSITLPNGSHPVAVGTHPHDTRRCCLLLSHPPRDPIPLFSGAKVYLLYAEDFGEDGNFSKWEWRDLQA